jgi:hypothetical protein
MATVIYASAPSSPYLALAMLFCAFTSASAADTDAALQQSLALGMRIRILAPDLSPSKIIGTVRQVSENSVTLEVLGHDEPVSISREKIARLEVSNGPRSRGVDAAIGAGIGVGIGAAGCALTHGSDSGHIVSRGAVTGACSLLGGGLGALIGMAISPGEQWRTVSQASYRLSFAPRVDHGFDFAVAWKF